MISAEELSSLKEESKREEEQEQEEDEEGEPEIDDLGVEKKKKTRRKKKKKAKAAGGAGSGSAVRNGFAGIPFEHQENVLPDHPTLYADHPRRMVYTQAELNKILPASCPNNLAANPWVVCGFLTPRTVIKQIEMFQFEQFVRRWPFVQSAKFMYDGMMYLGRKFGATQKDVDKCFDEVLAIELDTMLQFGAEHEFEMFVSTYKAELDSMFREKYGFQPTSELFKIFDAFPTEKEAETFVQQAKNHLGNKHMRIIIGDVREMLCFDPQDRDIKDKKYINQEVAQLMQQNNKNAKKRLDGFQQRMSRRIRAAYEENERIAKETGQKLTMEVDANGKIVKSIKDQVFADLANREAKPTAPPASQLAAAGAQGGMVEVAQCIESTDLKTGEKKTDVYVGKDASYSKF